VNMRRSRLKRTLPLVIAISLVILIPGIFIASCAVTKIIDQATVTAKGITSKNEIDAKANDGYDVREARSKWSQAFDAWTKGDYSQADQLIDQANDALKDIKKVAERIYYESSGGITVSGLLFRPDTGEGPWPLIVVNHSGFGTAGDFSEVALGIRDRGYLVFNPDFRGSGKSQGQHELAKGEVDDVINGIEYVKSRGLIEGGRIGMYGQSHGAAVSMLAAERYPIKAVVEESGFTDAVDLYDNAVAHQDDPTVKAGLDQALAMTGGTPDQVPEEYAVRSAINYVNDMTAPVLLIHGTQDPLIPVNEAYRMYDALIAAGKTAELKIYPDEAHTVTQPANRAEVWDLMFAWFEKYV
jgi:dipeptidyl aminopeptidase/acylaminoacyl peptidase